MIRRAGNRGSFYPRDCQRLKRMIDEFNTILDGAIRDENSLRIEPKAIISPHAGYIYSGFTANIAYKIASNSKPKRVVVIGPSHHIYLRGISIATSDYYETPCGDLAIDTEFVDELKRRFEISSVSNLHHVEHSTETQIPFIKYYEPKSRVVELIYGKYHHDSLSEIISYSIKAKDTLVVISSDLSHFYSLEDAKKLDNICLTGVSQKNSFILDKGCEACGLIGIKAVIEVARDMDFKVKLLDYRTSADITGDKDRVVGYMSAIIY